MKQTKQKSFLFDLNKCTGCGACVIACETEQIYRERVRLEAAGSGSSGNEPGRACSPRPGSHNFRTVFTFNETRHPALPVFHLSLACNHCLDPVCLTNCPARAYSKDPETGAVSINPAKCMGCKYCTWVCPYDAPKYNAAAGITQKCDFCRERIISGDKPACVSACPMTALQFSSFDKPAAKPLNKSFWPHLFSKRWALRGNKIPGFTDIGIQPAIEFIPLRRKYPVESSYLPSLAAVRKLFFDSLEVPRQKITLREEWALLLFTTVAYLLVAFFAAGIALSSGVAGVAGYAGFSGFAAVPEVVQGLGGNGVIREISRGNIFTGFSFYPLLFLGLGALAMILTVAHLGQKLRAVRAICNWHSSWLSREILFFSLFMAGAGLFLLFWPHLMIFGWLVVFMGFLSLFSIDRIYQVATQLGPLNFHSAHVLLNGLYLYGMLTLNPWFFVIFGLFKIILYLRRKIRFKQAGRNPLWVISGLRVLSGFLLPAVFFIMLVHEALPFLFFLPLVILVIAGEIIDRAEYYDEMDVITPPKQIQVDMLRMIAETGKS